MEKSDLVARCLTTPATPPTAPAVRSNYTPTTATATATSAAARPTLCGVAAASSRGVGGSAGPGSDSEDDLEITGEMDLDQVLQVRWGFATY